MFIKPMLAKKMNHDGMPEGDYIFETKWDGIRAIVVVDITRGSMKLFSRNGREITDQFPELTNRDMVLPFLVSGTFDAEIVCLRDGVAHFPSITSRLHLGSATGRAQGMKDNPATMVLFDILEVDKKAVGKKFLYARKELLNGAVTPDGPITISRVYADGDKLYREEARKGAEGIIAKRKTSLYLPGRRTQDWVKVKIMHEEEVEVYGFTTGLGKREGFFGALLFRDEHGNHLGNVGTGFTDEELYGMMLFLQTRGIGIGDKKGTFYLNKPFRIKVKGMRKNESGAIREPVFVKRL